MHAVCVARHVSSREETAGRDPVWKASPGFHRRRDSMLLRITSGTGRVSLWTEVLQ